MAEYKIIYSNRKTMSLQVTRDASVIVRAPYFTNKNIIEDFVKKHEKWTAEKTEKRKKENLLEEKTDVESLRAQALAYIPERVKYYSRIMGAKYSSVKITSAKTRYGSCSATNGLCFSLYVMLKPEKAIDYVIIHELAHTFHHNHSKEFYNVVKKYMPDYKNAIQLLKR